jgi:hypothetical protein
MGSLNMLGSTDLYMIAANHLFDLTLRTGTVINEHRLALAQLPHRRLLLEYLRRGRNHDAGQDSYYQENHEKFALSHNGIPGQGPPDHEDRTILVVYTSLPDHNIRRRKRRRRLDSGRDPVSIGIHPSHKNAPNALQYFLNQNAIASVPGTSASFLPEGRLCRKSLCPIADPIRRRWRVGSSIG